MTDSQEARLVTCAQTLAEHGYEGTDASPDISLIEYDFLARHFPGGEGESEHWHAVVFNGEPREPLFNHVTLYADDFDDVTADDLGWIGAEPDVEGWREIHWTHRVSDVLRIRDHLCGGFFMTPEDVAESVEHWDHPIPVGHLD